MDEIEDFFNNDDYGDQAEEVAEAGPSDEKILGDIFEKRRVKPKSMNPKRALNENILTGPKGLISLRDSFKNFKPNPKENPYNNLKLAMKKYEHWAHLMYPRMKFEDVVDQCEKVGTRRRVKVYMMKYRSGMSLEDGDFESTAVSSGKKDDIIDDGQDDAEVDALFEPGESERNDEEVNDPQKEWDELQKNKESQMDDVMADFDW